MTVSDLPEPQPSSKLRRSLRLEEQLTEAHQSQAQVLLTGSGVNDFFITRADQSRRLTAFLHGYCMDEKIGYVRYSMSDGVSSYRTLPGDEAVSVRSADADDHPAQVVRQVLADLRASATPAMFAFDYADGVLDAERMTLEVSLLCEHLQALTADTAWHKAGLRVVLIDRGGGITAQAGPSPGHQDDPRRAAGPGRAHHLRAPGGPGHEDGPAVPGRFADRGGGRTASRRPAQPPPARDAAGELRGPAGHATADR